MAPDHKLLFKKRQFFNENWSDQDLVHMEYIQIREDVLRNRYILEESQWLQLSAIDLRVTYGSPDVSKHVAGFLTFVIINLNYVLFFISLHLFIYLLFFTESQNFLIDLFLVLFYLKNLQMNGNQFFLKNISV